MDPQLRSRLEAALQRIKAEMELKRKNQPYLEVGAVGTIVILAAFYTRHGEFIMWSILGTIAALGYLYKKPYLEAVSKFKSFILPKIAEVLRPGLRYSPTGTLGSNRFRKADLFPEGFDEYREEDEFRGRSKEVSFGLREVTLVDVKGSGKNKRRVTVFQGIAMNLEFPKNFQGHTHVGPDQVESVLGGYLTGLVQDAGKVFSQRKRVQLEHPDFEKMFVVTATNEMEARYLITPKMMELLMKFRSEFGNKVVFSFFENHLYISFPFAPIHFPFDNPQALDMAIEKMETLLALVDHVIEVLELDNQIWKKTG